MIETPHLLRARYALVSLYLTVYCKYSPLLTKDFCYSVTVPKIQLKYMLNRKLHVIWRENETTGYNYTAYICCSKVWSNLGSGCPSFCPKFFAMNSVGSGMGTGNRQSSLTVYAYLKYAVYLSGKKHGCDLMGKVAKFKPMLRSK